MRAGAPRTGTAGWLLPQYIGWGTSGGTATISQTTLFAEASETRGAGTTSMETDTPTDDTFQMVGTLISSSSKTNTGVFDVTDKTDANDKIIMKGDFTGIGMDSGDAIQFTFRWRINNS